MALLIFPTAAATVAVPSERTPQFGHHLPVLNRPTPAQLEAGNYPKERRTFQGLPVTIENPRGSIRSGVSRAGVEWATSMQHDYGYVRGTLGVDGDAFDVYLGPDSTAPMAYVITTKAPPDFRRNDEQKAMLGFASEDAARAAFLAHYDDPRFLGAVTPMTVERFKDLLATTKAAPRLLKGMALVWAIR